MPEPDDDEPEDGDESQLDPADAPPSAADESALAAQRSRNRSYARQREAFWRGVLADPVGRREIWNILGFEAHGFEVKLACGPNGFPQSEATWMALGEQLLGQRIYQTLQTLDFEGAFLMLSEHDPRFKKPAKAKR